ncbi:MAG: AcrB/AcrD/AcrF family protein [Gammaproteobacteria bacterium]|nr:MAG: AcrB/AcrD/AcrF family protein [Gammaproteobacteria bacterium]RKZ42549.1 MAG: AcrB/AcrD/AcrF family protein [Gammaproteobacteria bacterium]
MNIAEYAIRKKTVTLVLTFLLVGGGFLSYEKLGRLEDPEFTIKDALIITNYPGALPTEVEEEVTDILETAIQQIAQLDRVTSISKAGQSIITVTMKDKYDKHTLPQIWDELRRKVNDVQAQLPPGIQPSFIYDDFGDVYGIFFAVTGEGFSYKELKDYVDFLKRELLLVQEVAKIDIWGAQQEAVFVEISRSKLAQLGISLETIYGTLEHQNLVAPAGEVKVGSEEILIHPTGDIDSVEEIGELLINDGSSDKLFYLKDVATISRGYMTPPQKLLRFNGKPGLAIGISIVSGGNVVTLGKAIKAKLKTLEAQTPLGIELGIISYQSDAVEKAMNGFIDSLLLALAIVIIVLLIFMGMRSGLLIGVILILTVCATLIVMDIYDINLQRISLGALIIALGMLVDNAIVITDGILIKIQQGEERIKAAIEVVEQTMWPLLGATVVAILAFAAIGLSQNAAGEFTRALFQVILISLMMSWLIAVTITPLFCVLFLKPSLKQTADPYRGILYQIYQWFLRVCIRFRWLTIMTMFGLLFLAIYGFGFLEDSFFPGSTRPQFMINYWRVEGTDIRETSEDLKQIEKFLMTVDGIESVASFVGGGALRFILLYTPEKNYKSYGQLLVTVKDYREIDHLIPKVRQYLAQTFPDAEPKIKKFKLGPGSGAQIKVRFSGPDPVVLRQLSNQAQAIMHADGGALEIRDDWRQRVKMLRPQFAEAQARVLGISRSALSQSLETVFSGTQVGVYREGNKRLSIISRPPEAERVGVDNIKNIHLWSPAAQHSIPLRQIVSGFETVWIDPLIHRRNRKRTIIAQCDPKVGNASVVFERIRPKIEAIELPLGYEMEWGGEYEDSTNAQKALSVNLPITFLIMVVIVIFLFNALRQALIIWLCVPLAIIGVTPGLLLAGESFGFMALLGFLSLTGMLIKNAIVLIDQIDLEIREGKAPFYAILDSSVSRLRPVTMAAITTVLGMIPLIFDAFFISMAVTIMFGLAFATILTLIVVPVLYAIFFRVAYEKN